MQAVPTRAKRDATRGSPDEAALQRASHAGTRARGLAGAVGAGLGEGPGDPSLAEAGGHDVVKFRSLPLAAALVVAGPSPSPAPTAAPWSRGRVTRRARLAA
jgi:hypothetical protein